MDEQPQRASKPSQLWKLLLLLPVIGLCFPAMYARTTPTLLGFPFFYSYQLGWVLLSACVMGLAYRKLR